MKKPSNLLDQGDAVGSYLAEMLSAPVDVPPATAEPTSKQAFDNLILLRQALEQVPDKDAELPIAEAPEPADHKSQERAEVTGDSPEPVSAELEFPLQCLMFSVGNQQLSMPLIQMSGVVEAPETLSRLPGSASCVQGSFQYRGKNIQVIDSARLLGIKRDPEQRSEKLIVLQGEQWAITADQLANVVAIDEVDVKWHRAGQANMTLGTIKSSLAQLLNPQTIVHNLTEGTVFTG